MRMSWQERRSQPVSPAFWGRLLAGVCLVAYVHLLAFHVATADHHSGIAHADTDLEHDRQAHTHGSHGDEGHTHHSSNDHSLELIPHKYSVDLGIEGDDFALSIAPFEAISAFPSTDYLPTQKPLGHRPEHAQGARAPPHV